MQNDNKKHEHSQESSLTSRLPMFQDIVLRIEHLVVCDNLQTAVKL